MGGGPEGVEEEQERIHQVQSFEPIWKGNQFQHIHNQGDTNRFAVVYKTVPSDKVNLEEALKEYSECQEGKVRVRVEVNKSGGKLEADAVAADVATIVDLPTGKVCELSSLGEGGVLVGFDNKPTQDIRELVDEARSMNRRPMINSRGTLKNIRVEQMRDPRERDLEERTMTFFAVPISQDTGTHHRAYCMALESERGKQLFERDQSNPALVRLQIGRSNLTKIGTIVGEKVYNGKIECQVLPKVDPEEVKQAMGGDETPFCVDLGGVLTERTLGGKYGCRSCNRLWCGQGGGINCFRVTNKRVTKQEREEDAKRDRERLNVRDTHPRRALWGRIDEAEDQPVKH